VQCFCGVANFNLPAENCQLVYSNKMRKLMAAINMTPDGDCTNFTLQQPGLSDH
jgi:hypothetical protein